MGYDVAALGRVLYWGSIDIYAHWIVLKAGSSTDFYANDLSATRNLSSSLSTIDKYILSLQADSGM